MTPSDQTLIGLMNAGDESAFQTLYYRHRDWMFRMAYRITTNEQLAQDVLQDAFCYFLGKFPNFELRCELRTFLYPVVKNTSLNLLKKSRRMIGGDEGNSYLAEIHAPETNLKNFQDFTAMIAHLSEDHREILFLRFVDRLTMPEIAKLVGIPEGTAKSRLHHALAALRSKCNVSLYDEIN